MELELFGRHSPPDCWRIKRCRIGLLWPFPQAVTDTRRTQRKGLLFGFSRI